jgi:YegS/Rv2252/BmrU family lipid kinase
MKAAIIFNPRAGRWRAAQVVEWATEALEAYGWSAKTKSTARAGQMRALAAEAIDEGAETVFAAGGDGTVGAVAGALAGSGTALGVIPIGTANLWATELGLVKPRELLESADRVRGCIEAQVAGIERRVDMGRASDHTFLLWAGIGLDAHVIRKIEPRPEIGKLFGAAYIVLAGLLAAIDFRGAPMTIRTENGTIAGDKLLAVVANVRLYAGTESVLDPGSRADDGVFEAWAIEGQSFADALVQLDRYQRGEHLTHPSAQKLRGRNIEIELARPLPLQFDGEVVGEVTHAEFNVWPAALKVLTPRLPAPIFLDSE